MKTVKSYFLFLILALLLSLCVLKSLCSFYTKDVLYFEPKFIGNWFDSSNGSWEIVPYQKAFIKESTKKYPKDLDTDEQRLYSKYRNGYAMYFKKDNTETSFLAMPFKFNIYFRNVIKKALTKK